MEREPGEHTRDRKKAWKEKKLVFCLPGTGRRAGPGWSSVPGGHCCDPTTVRPALGVASRRGAWRWAPRPPSAAAGRLQHTEQAVVRVYAPSSYSQRRPAAVASGRGGDWEVRRTQGEWTPCLIFGPEEAKGSLKRP